MFRSVRQTQTHCRALGIDLGRYRIKAVVVEETSNGLTISHAATVRTPDGVIDQGVITDQPAVAAIIRQIVKGFDLPLTSAALSTPIEHTLVRWIEMPQMDEESLTAAAKFEAKKYVTYPIEQAEVTIVPMECDETQGDNAKIRALLIAAPSEVVTSRAATLELAGLEVDSIESEAMAVLRALERQETPKGRFWHGQSLAFLLIGEESSGMIVSRDGVMTLNRAIPWGANRLIETLAERNAISHDEARDLLALPSTYIGKDASLNWETQDATRQNNALSKDLRRLMNEIARIANYYSSLCPASSYEGLFHRLILCGGLAGTRGLSEYLSHGLQLSARVCRTFESPMWGLSPNAAVAVQGNEPGMAVAFGLALGKLENLITTGEGNPTREYLWQREAA